MITAMMHGHLARAHGHTYVIHHLAIRHPVLVGRHVVTSFPLVTQKRRVGHTGDHRQVRENQKNRHIDRVVTQFLFFACPLCRTPRS